MALAAVLCCAVGWGVLAQRAGAGRVRWEYKIYYLKPENIIFKSDYDKQLNALGEEGWELVQAPSDAESGPYFFRRQK